MSSPRHPFWFGRCCCNVVSRYGFRYRYRYCHGRPRGRQGQQGQRRPLNLPPPRDTLINFTSRRNCLGRLLISLTGPLAIGPVANLPARLVKVAARAIPIDTHAEVLVARRLASVAVAEAPIPPVVVSAAAATPISVLPLFTSNPVRAVVTLSPLFFAEGL